MIILANQTAAAAKPGDTILAALKRAEKNIHSICGGRGMCGTCRVAVDAAWFAKLPQASANENRLLAALKNAAPHHRLACQTILSAAHDGLRFVLDPPFSRTLTQETTA